MPSSPTRHCSGTMAIIIFRSRSIPQNRRNSRYRKKSIGIDLGIKHQLTLSAGMVIDYTIKMPANIHPLYQSLSRKTRGSKNYYKTLIKLQKCFAVWTNRKQDVINKLTHVLTTRYKYLCYQRDPVKNWQRLWGTRVLDTNIGGLLTKLSERSVTPCPVGQWIATTKRCYKCQYVLDTPVGLAERVFRCPNCSFVTDRDWNASASIEDLGLELNHCQYYYLLCGTERITTPVETSASTRNKELNDVLVATLNLISFVRVNILDKTVNIDLKSWEFYKEAQSFSLR